MKLTPLSMDALALHHSGVRDAVDPSSFLGQSGDPPQLNVAPKIIPVQQHQSSIAPELTLAQLEGLCQGIFNKANSDLVDFVGRDLPKKWLCTGQSTQSEN